MTKIMTKPNPTDGDNAIFAMDLVIKNPAVHFSMPSDVVEHQQYSDGEKVEILRAWELDAHQRQVAADESMDGGIEPDLHDVLAALRRMGLGPNKHDVSTKLGG